MTPRLGCECPLASHECRRSCRPSSSSYAPLPLCLLPLRFASLSPFSFCVLATVSALLRSSITDILHQPPRARRQSPAEQRHAYSVTRYARKMGQRRRRRRRGQLEQTWFSQGRTLRIEIAKKPTTREVTFAAPTTVHPPGKETTYSG